MVGRQRIGCRHCSVKIQGGGTDIDLHPGVTNGRPQIIAKRDADILALHRAHIGPIEKN